MPFKPGRLVKLREAKGIRTHEELAGVTGLNRSLLWKYENGTATPTADALETLANRLDATMGYFHGRGKKYKSPQRAAIEMSFDVFGDQTRSAEQRDWCGRVVPHDGAPRTAAAWRVFAEMIELAIGPSSPPSSNFGLLKGGKP